MKKGKKIFIQKCQQCHSFQSGKNGQGPSLFALFGRDCGTVANFNYTDANKGKLRIINLPQ
jgi:cytochrome c